MCLFVESAREREVNMETENVRDTKTQRHRDTNTQHTHTHTTHTHTHRDSYTHTHTQHTHTHTNLIQRCRGQHRVEGVCRAAVADGLQGARVDDRDCGQQLAQVAELKGALHLAGLLVEGGKMGKLWR